MSACSASAEAPMNWAMSGFEATRSGIVGITAP